MELLGRKVSEFCQKVSHSDVTVDKINLRNGFILRLSASHVEGHVELLKYDPASVWSFTYEPLRNVFVENDTLVGLAGFEDVKFRVEKRLVVSAKPSRESLIVVLRGSNRFGLLRDFYRSLNVHAGFRFRIPKSLINEEELDQKTDQQTFVLLKDPGENTLRRLLKKEIRVAVKVEDEHDLEHLYRIGVRCFVLKDFRDEHRQRYPHACFILEEGSLATALGRVDGLMMNIGPLSLEEIVLASLTNRLLTLYTAGEDSKLLDVLGFGAVGWRRKTNFVLTTIRQEQEGVYEVRYVNEFNEPARVRIDTITGAIDWFDSSKETRLEKKTLKREDGRYFHFYTEGGS
ncbi:hypothetical protein AS159_01865 [Thermotoga sp. Ku-13t]|uniref:hypothetical protein n=1 Tax=Thermotoga sp. Ku-13t TaxID=1755813 RepID=UPI0013EAE054|nr:hypothetical protein [Thermotoga sp. Ku-13t]KAF2958472.1 hypothetical protein AS159_01865 [Thermotoga sp. Ku-13t]